MVKLGYNDAYDTAILVSSDGDFVPAVLAVKELGKNIENIITRLQTTVAARLLDA